MLVIAVRRSGEPEVGGAYKIQSGNHSLKDTPAHTHHRIPATRHLALTLKYRSLRSNRRSIRHSCTQSQKIRRQCSLEKKPTGEQSEEHEEKSC
jgi:hypothetical protein